MENAVGMCLCEAFLLCRFFFFRHDGLAEVRLRCLKVNCPHCGEMHEISVRETYINGALQDATDRLRNI